MGSTVKRLGSCEGPETILGRKHAETVSMVTSNMARMALQRPHVSTNFPMPGAKIKVRLEMIGKAKLVKKSMRPCVACVSLAMASRNPATTTVAFAQKENAKTKSQNRRLDKRRGVLLRVESSSPGCDWSSLLRVDEFGSSPVCESLQTPLQPPGVK